MNTPFKKRNSPLTAIQPVAVQHEDDLPKQPQQVEQKVVQEPVFVEQPKPIQQPVRKPVQQPVYYQQQPIVKDNNREKYTATMERDLRIRVKIAATRKGMQFSQFIEEAVLEKLGREGY